MLFKRVHKRCVWDHIRDFIWPRIGWKRSFLYIKNRLIRIPASDKAIARGFAFGCAISWTPLFGTHIIQCYIFCKIFRANFFASIIGTCFGNLWTFPVLWGLAVLCGNWIFGMFGYDIRAFDYGQGVSFQDMMSSSFSLTMPPIVGGYVLAIISFPLFYVPFFYMVKGARAARIKMVALKKVRVEKKKRQK